MFYSCLAFIISEFRGKVEGADSNLLLAAPKTLYAIIVIWTILNPSTKKTRKMTPRSMSSIYQ